VNACFRDDAPNDRVPVPNEMTALGQLAMGGCAVIVRFSQHLLIKNPSRGVRREFFSVLRRAGGVCNPHNSSLAERNYQGLENGIVSNLLDAQNCRQQSSA
jgi:hypothetical protein